MIGLLLVSAVAPAVMAQTDESLAVDVTQDETGETVITAADNGTAVENATVTVTATDGTGTATTAVEPVPPEPVEPFGQVVSAFVDVVKGAGFTGIGSQVSDFVTSNNPSNAGNSGAVTSPEAGNDAPVTPPGQGTKNDSGAVPVTRGRHRGSPETMTRTTRETRKRSARTATRVTATPAAMADN